MLNENRTLAEEMLLNYSIDNEKVTLINGCFGQGVSVQSLIKSIGKEIKNPLGFKF